MLDDATRISQRWMLEKEKGARSGAPEKLGGEDDGARTRNLPLSKRTLYPLSYAPDHHASRSDSRMRHPRIEVAHQCFG